MWHKIFCIGLFHMKELTVTMQVTLSVQQHFIEAFNYGDKGCGQHKILCDFKRLKLSNTSQLEQEFKQWKKKSQQLVRQATETNLRVVAVGAVRRLGVEEDQQNGVNNCLKTQANVDDVQGLEVVGLLQYGLKMSSITMDVPVNYVHRVTRTKSVIVPSDWNSLSDFRKVLFMALSIKEMVSRTIKLLQKKLDNNDDDLGKVMEPPEIDSYQLPQTFDSQE